jgi:heterodisulfide reductase subunit B
MKYNYYPGCSLEKNASAYHDSTMAVAGPLDIQFTEVEDWNCCGAIELIAIDKMQAYALTARNLAQAQKQTHNGETLVAPCSACFLNLSKCDAYLRQDEVMTAKVNDALSAGGLHYTPGTVKARHLLEVAVNDVGYETIAAKVKKPLRNLRVAPYYGCLIVRPGFQEKFDNPEHPTSLDDLMRTLGATVVDFPMKAHCCGGHMTQISEKVALDLIHRLLRNAADYGADAIVAICPMCQLNLDAYQENVNKAFGTNYNIPILYFTQLMGLAFGLNPDELGFGKEFIDAAPALAKIGVEPPKPTPKAKADKNALPMPIMPEKE